MRPRHTISPTVILMLAMLSLALLVTEENKISISFCAQLSGWVVGYIWVIITVRVNYINSNLQKPAEALKMFY